MAAAVVRQSLFGGGGIIAFIKSPSAILGLAACDVPPLAPPPAKAYADDGRAAGSAAASQRLQLALLSAAASAVFGSATAMAQCWAAGAVEEMTDAVALRSTRGRRLLATGSARDPARVEALSVAALGEMLSRRPEEAHSARRKGAQPDADELALHTMLRFIFGDKATLALSHNGTDGEGHNNGALATTANKAEPPPTHVVFEASAAREYLDGRWREGPTQRDVQPLLVGHLDDDELAALAHNAQVCRRLPSAKRRKDSIAGT
jgi:hypothetical protein